MTELQNRPYSLRVLERIEQISRSEWQGLKGTSQPFLRHAFLHALEASGSVGPETGWQPRHLVVNHADGRVLAALPLYEKHHSYGEYIFDWAWAEAYHRHGLPYYPKLSAAIPFSPVAGTRLLLAPNAPADLGSVIQAGLTRLGDELRASSCHVLHHQAEEVPLWKSAGFLERHSLQYHWQNRHYRDFADYLDGFTSASRKKLKRERRQIAESGLVIRRLTGTELTEGHWDAFYRFYCTTYRKRSGFDGYLNREFFSRLGETMAEQILLVLAEDAGKAIAGALFLHDDETLYGRYWGCLRPVNALHFELCYYQGMEFCLERGLKRFEPGAQGEYKIQRGFEPQVVFSSHRLAHPDFHQAVADYLERERQAVMQEQQALREHLPFRIPQAAS